MTEKIIKLQSSDERWKAFLDSTPHANIFHHPHWSGILTTCYGYQSFILAFFDKNDNISAGIPFVSIGSTYPGKRWVSLPFSDHCQPLLRDNVDIDEVTLGLIDISRKLKGQRIEVRWGLSPNYNIQLASNFVQHTLNLDQGIETILKSLHRTQRQNIRTAEKNNVQILRGENLDDLKSFYRLHCLTRRRQGVPVQPWRFFELLFERLISKGLGFILIAQVGGQDLAAGLFLKWKKTLLYKYAASSDTNHDLRPNHLLTWSAICWGQENGYSLFDFGRTDLSNEGLRTFKIRWGANETPLAYSYFASLPNKKSIRINTFMQKIIQNSPVWVCKLVGEALYRHFG